jgi:hypothetical protein
MSITNLPLLLALTGCIALLAGLFGGGLKLQEVVIPTIPQLPRVFSGLAGIALIAMATWLYARTAVPSAPQPTEVAKTVALSSPESSSPANVSPQPPAPTDTPTPLPPAAATEAPTLAITATLSPSATPIVANPKNPAGFFRYYFSMITDRRDYGDAWQLLSRKYQQKNYPNGSIEFGKYWNTIDSVDLNSIQVTPVTTSAVDCSVDATFHTKAGAADQVTATYRLIYDLTQQTWMIDAP